MMSRYFRNLVEVTSIEGVKVDAGSLWVWVSGRNKLVLVDEDQDLTCSMSTEGFENIAEDEIQDDFKEGQ